jgi:alpha-tubulin suppressor-like RCC1 family protein
MIALPRLALTAYLITWVIACSGTDTNEPNPTPVDSVVLAADESTIRATRTVAIKAQALDAAGNSIPNASFGWASSNNLVATVDATGIVRGISPGSVTITAAAGGKVGTFAIDVIRAPLAAITVNIPAGELVVGKTLQIHAVGIDSAAKTATDVLFRWESSDTTIAVIDPRTGLVTALRRGTARIDASAEGITGSSLITIAGPPPIRFKIISAHEHHSCGLSVEGTVFCWGRDFNGTLGAGSPPPVTEECGPGFSLCTSRPIPVAGDNVFSDLSEGMSFHTCAIGSHGTQCWGNGELGQIGDGAHAVRNAVPTSVKSSATYTSLSVGGAATCGVTTLNTIECWGSNASTQLGDSTITERCPVFAVEGESVSCSTTPRLVSSPITFKRVSVGTFSACALGVDGTAYCWGASALGTDATSQCGGCNKTPTAVASDLRFTDISVGYRFACAVSTGGRAYCWGENSYGQLGIGTFTAKQQYPVAVSSTSSFVKVFTGGGHACGLDAAGAAYCWGVNISGAVGDGSFTDTATPILIGNGLRFSSLSLGTFHSCGIATDGYAYCWGYNANLQLGIGGREGPALIPTRVAGQ